MVWVHYNNEQHKQTIELTRQIREALHGPLAKTNALLEGDVLATTKTLQKVKSITGSNINLGNNSRMSVLTVEETTIPLEYQDINRKLNLFNVPGSRVTANAYDTSGINQTFEFFRINPEFMTKIERGSEIQGGQLSLTTGSTISLSEWKKLKEMDLSTEYGFVVNTHKVQGGTYKNVVVSEDNILANQFMTNKKTNQSLYTAFSRAKENLYIYNQNNPQSPPSEGDNATNPLKDICNGL